MSSPVPHLDSFIEFCQGVGLSEFTIHDYKRRIETFWKRMPGKWTTEAIRKYFESIAETRNCTTLRQRQVVLNVFLNWCHEGRLITKNPMPAFVVSTIPPKKKPIYTRADLEALMAAARDTSRRMNHQKYWEPALLIAWHTGLRIMDICNLKWASIDIEEKLISLIPNKTKRLGKIVTIPMAPELYAKLKEMYDWKEELGFDPTYVLDTMPYRRDLLTVEFRDLAKLAKVPFSSIHGFRRSFVSRLVNSNIQLETICSLTGHSRRSVETYISVSMKTKQSAMAAIQEAV